MDPEHWKRKIAKDVVVEFCLFLKERVFLRLYYAVGVREIFFLLFRYHYVTFEFIPDPQKVSCTPPQKFLKHSTVLPTLCVLKVWWHEATLFVFYYFYAHVPVSKRGDGGIWWLWSQP
jgi:hypothetical protein